MYHFAKTSPEITNTTVKHMTEIVKHLKKRVNQYEIAAAASYSHRKMLPTR
jgi:hypothetical protein